MPSIPSKPSDDVAALINCFAFHDGALNTPSLGLTPLWLSVLETGPERPGDGSGDPPMPDQRYMYAKETIGEANSSVGWDGDAKSTL